MKKSQIGILVALYSLQVISGSKWTQGKLEDWVYSRREGCDDLSVEQEYVPEWKKDSLSEYSQFIGSGGWTTNDLIEGFAFAITNRLNNLSWANERDQDIAALSFDALAKINHPVANALIHIICTNDVKDILGEGVQGVFRYSEFDPTVFEFMRTLCVSTNSYERWVGNIALDMRRCFRDHPNHYCEAATNGLARYHYFVIKHATRDVGLVDRLLASWTPSYSNSIQRLNAMRYVSSTATNNAMLSWANREVQRLSALPTNELNNVSWLEE